MSPSVPGVGWGIGNLLWRDDFTQSTLGDFPAEWVFDNTCSNQNLQANMAANSVIGNDGTQNVLQLIAKAESLTNICGANWSYSGAQILAGINRVVPRGGYIEWDAEIPMQAGVWPALWLMGNNASFSGYPVSGWPACGEVDVMENLTADSTTVSYSTVHFPNGSGGAAQYGGAAQAPASTPTYLTGYNRWGVLLGPTSTAFYLNGVNYFTVTEADVTALGTWVFDSFAYVPYMSIYVGGASAGTPPSTTPWPITMNVKTVAAYSGLP